MAVVFIPALLRPAVGGAEQVTAEGATVRQLIEGLDRLYPGLAAKLVENGRLRPNISVAVDGEISPLGLLEAVSPSSEVHFLTAIKGGADASRDGARPF